MISVYGPLVSGAAATFTSLGVVKDSEQETVMNVHHING